MRLSIHIERVTSGEIAGAWRVSAYRGNDYLGNEAFLWYSKREALRLAREIIKKEGGLGIWRKSRA